MFTGLIVEMWEVESLRPSGTGATIVLKEGPAAKGAEIGDSIAINGVCLTVTSIEHGRLSFDASSETLSSTGLGTLRPGDRVNIEPSLRADGKLGGHFVTGHVDAVGSIRRIEKDGETWRIEVSAPDEVLRYLVDKGSVAVDGVSLTVVKVFEEYFTLVIIPHTAMITTIGEKKTGDGVNLEADIIGKYVYRFLGRDQGGSEGGGSLTDALRESGFMS
jgi:riboflavin synthase